MLLQRHSFDGRHFPNLSELSEITTVLSDHLAKIDFATPSSLEILSEILRFQEQGGSFRYFDTWQVPSDARVDFCYTPTYICTSILMKYYLHCRDTGKTLPTDFENAFARALKACCGRELFGHGYEGTREQLDALHIFINGGLKRFLQEDDALCPDFTIMIRKILDTYAERLARSNTKGMWGEEYAQDYQSILQILRSALKRYYLAYGSNMNIEQMRERCPTARYIGVVYLKDHRLQFNMHATIERTEGEQVPAILWELQESDEEALDGYEGIRNHHYYKDYLTVEKDGETVRALVYIMDRPGIVRKGGNAKPDDDYYQKIVQGYKDAGIDETPLKSAYARTLQNQG
jgi:hypothetical protein